TTRAEIYRALVEATAFGARAIIARMEQYHVPIERVVCCGGIAEKNDLFMQVYADVIGMPMLTAGSPQTPALGAAIAAAVAAAARAARTSPVVSRGGSGLRERVCQSNLALVASGLVTETFGNVSGVDRAAGLFVIKPSGVPYEALTPANLVAVSLETGRVLDG